MGGVSPGSIANSLPPAEDDQARKSRDLARAQREQGAARSLEATSIGEGGLRVIGGKVSIEAGGTLEVAGNATFNGSLTVPAGSLNTAGDITAGDTVTGDHVVALVDATVGGALTAGSVGSAGRGTFDTGVTSVGAYNELLSGSGGTIRALWIHPDGRLGYLPSSSELKLNPEPARYTAEQVLTLQGVFYRYLAQVPYDQAQQPLYLGLLAQDVHAAGFHQLVDYDADGNPAGVRYAELGVVLLEGMRDLHTRLVALEQRP